MAYIKYFAKRGVIATHTAGIEYSIEFNCPVLQPRFKDDREDIPAWDKSGRDTLLFGIEELWDVVVGHPYVVQTDFALWVEFFKSCAGGESLTFDPYGSLASPNNPINVELQPGWSIPRNNHYMKYKPTFGLWVPQ